MEWQSIKDAPKDGTPVCLWSQSLGFLNNYVREELSKTNVFYTSVREGYSCVRDATHFIIIVAPV